MSKHAVEAVGLERLKDELIWGVPAIAGELGLKERQVYHLLATDQLPARKVGAKWVASRTKLRAYLLGEAAAA